MLGYVEEASASAGSGRNADVVELAAQQLGVETLVHGLHWVSPHKSAVRVDLFCELGVWCGWTGRNGDGWMTFLKASSAMASFPTPRVTSVQGRPGRRGARPRLVWKATESSSSSFRFIPHFQPTTRKGILASYFVLVLEGLETESSRSALPHSPANAVPGISAVSQSILKQEQEVIQRSWPTLRAETQI